MTTQTFEIKINAPAERVWHTLFDKKTYGEWTKHFAPDGDSGSRMESDWEVNGVTRFTDKHGNGMTSTIKQLEPNKVVLFEHNGVLIEGSKIPYEKTAEQFKGAYELYELRESGDVTKLTVKIMMPNDHADMMKKGFERGLEEIRGMAEANNHAIKIL